MTTRREFLRNAALASAGLAMGGISTKMNDAGYNRVVGASQKVNLAQIGIGNRHVQHWLNGIKIIEYQRNNQMWQALVNSNVSSIGKLQQIQKLAEFWQCRGRIDTPAGSWR